MKLRTLIIDDERSGRENLGNLVQRFTPQIEIVGYGESVETGRRKILAEHPDLVFLDIEMPDGSGFDLLQSLDQVDFQVIFVTAYNQYAIKAFKFSAVDYILKPVNIDDLKAAVKKAGENKGKEDTFSRLRLEMLGQNLLRPNDQDNSITLPSLDGFIFVKVKDIIHVKAAESYSDLHLTDNRKLTVSRNLSDIEEMLTEYRFFRVHKSHLVNLNHLVRYHRGRGGSIELSDGSEIEVSRRKKDDFLRSIGG